MTGVPRSNRPTFPEGRTIASVSELRDAGITRPTLSRRVTNGEFVKVDGTWGLYALPGREAHAEEDVIRVALQCPGAVICLLTAMRLHGLDAPPAVDVWVAIGTKTRPRSAKHLTIRSIHMGGKALAYGVEPMTIGEITVSITSPAKTVVDGFKYRSQIGARTATQALRSCLDLGKANADQIWAAAEVVRVRGLIRPLLEAFA